MALPRRVVCTGGMLLWLAACTTPPGLEAGAPLRASDQPIGLLPLNDLLAQAQGGVVEENTAADLLARAAKLRARAAAP